VLVLVLFLILQLPAPPACHHTLLNCSNQVLSIPEFLAVALPAVILSIAVVTSGGLALQPAHSLS